MNRKRDFQAILGYILVRYLRPPTNNNLDETGYCNVCGKDSKFTFNSTVIPNKQFNRLIYNDVFKDYQRRESMFCTSCHASKRTRNIVDAFINATKSTALNYETFVSTELFASYKVAIINSLGPFTSIESRNSGKSNVSYSEFSNNGTRGEIINGIPSEDICSLSYSDNSFDVLLCSDVLEHVLDLESALNEVRRVLKDDGLFIFTVPINWKLEKSYKRAVKSASGKIIHIKQKLLHGRGRGIMKLATIGRGYITFHEFGRDFPDFMQINGFELSIYPMSDLNDATGADFVFVSRNNKRGMFNIEAF